MKKRNFIAVSLFLIAALLFSGWNIFLSIWKIRPAKNIQSMEVFYTLNDEYRRITVTDREEIFKIRELIYDMENKIHVSNVVGIKAVEHCQIDPQAEITVKFDNGITQVIIIQGTSVGLYNYSPNSKHCNIHYLRLKNIDTGRLLDELYLQIEKCRITTLRLNIKLCT